MSEILIHGSLSATLRMNVVLLELSEVCGLPEDPRVMLSLILMIEEMPRMPSENLMVKMAGELNSHTTPGVVEVAVAVAVVVVVVVDGLVLI